MKQITIADLQPFQKLAASDLITMIQEYPNERFRARYDADTGDLLPFLCRLRAITGAGKTPILAHSASLLTNGIILWTTNRGAVVSQTWSNLQPDGKYGQLLPNGTNVYYLGNMSASDWEATINSQRGLTILLSTVASFNQAGDELKIHRKQGDFTRWEMLGNVNVGGRKRDLYVFYDEGHGATHQQFERLKELHPKAFILASASPLPDDLAELLSGRTIAEKEQSLKDRTVIVPTKKVVESGLLKKRLYIMDCNTTQADAVGEAQSKWEELVVKLAPYKETPIACFIVNETNRGIDVWEHLVNLGVTKSRIATHLQGAAETMRDQRGSLMGLVDTYTGKRPEERSPQKLRNEGYTHIIWNMTLREGWDEPLAYVAYIDDRGRSVTDMVQKIGRFIRQPNAIPFDDPDLNSAYFYLKVPDTEFTTLIRETQEEMEVDGYEVISSHNPKVPTSRTVEVLQPLTISKISPRFGDNVKDRDEIVLNNITLYADKALRSVGSIQTRVIDLANMEEDRSQRQELVRENNDIITPWMYLSARLARIDSRLVDELGTSFSPELKDHEVMKQEMQYNSDAMRQVDIAITRIREQLNELAELVSEGKYDVFTVKPFKLISPDITGVPEGHRERYRVRSFKNAAHAEYNGLNPFEVKVAEALDVLGKVWCRNPSIASTGYKIPIPYLGADTIWFYPDFLLWTEKEIWAIDPKGKHLLEAAVQNKLLDFTTKNDFGKPVRVALILEGKYIRDDNLRWSKDDKDGFTLIRRVGGQVNVRHDEDLEKLVRLLSAGR